MGTRKQVCANICIGKCRDMLNKFMIVVCQTGSAVRYGSEGTTAYEQWKKIKIREGGYRKTDQKEKKKGKQRWREKNEWNEECKSEKRRLFQSTIFKEGGGRQKEEQETCIFQRGKREASEY